MSKNDKPQAQKKGGGKVPSRQALYNKIAGKSDKVLQTLFELLDSPNDSIRLGAAKVLMNKIIPDLKATELSSSESGEPLNIQIIAYDGYVPDKNN